MFDEPISVGESLSPVVDLHVVGVVHPMWQCTLGDIYDDKGNSMLALPLLEHFKGQRVEVTVRVLEEDKCLDTR